MKVVFLYPAFSSLAIETLAGALRARGHECALVFDPCLFDDSFVTMKSLAGIFSMKKKVVSEVIAHKPDVVAFSVVTSDFPWFRQMGAMIREQCGAKIIAGNIHVTSAPENVLAMDFIDAISRGESDHAICDMIDSLAQGGEFDPNIENLGIMVNGEPKLNPLRPLVQDLDSLAYPDKSLFMHTPINASDIYTIMTTRGCPYKCSFCNNSLMKRLYGLKGYVRFRSVDNVIDELEFGKKTYNSTHVNFYDEVFGVNKNWLRDFKEKYNSKIGLPYIACTNPNTVDREYAALLHESGCTKVDIGVQTINEQKRRDIYHRRESTEKIRESISILKEAGVYVAAENIANFPTEEESDMVEMATFYNEVRPDVLKVFWLRYFPGTEIVDIAKEHGVLTDADIKLINDGEHIGSITIDSSSPKLHRQFYFMYVLTQMLPEKLVKKMIERKWYRFLPTVFLPNIMYTAYRLMMKKSPDAEIMMRQHADRYKYYLKRFFFPWTRKPESESV